jgi:hypothetical protein
MTVRQRAKLASRRGEQKYLKTAALFVLFVFGGSSSSSSISTTSSESESVCSIKIMRRGRYKIRNHESSLKRQLSCPGLLQEVFSQERQLSFW